MLVTPQAKERRPQWKQGGEVGPSPVLTPTPPMLGWLITLQRMFGRSLESGSLFFFGEWILKYLIREKEIVYLYVAMGVN